MPILMEIWAQILIVMEFFVVAVLCVHVITMMVDLRRGNALGVDMHQGNTWISAPVQSEPHISPLFLRCLQLLQLPSAAVQVNIRAIQLILCLLCTSASILVAKGRLFLIPILAHRNRTVKIILFCMHRCSWAAWLVMAPSLPLSGHLEIPIPMALSALNPTLVTTNRIRVQVAGYKAMLEDRKHQIHHSLQQIGEGG